TLKNVSDESLTLANPGGNCAFDLVWVNSSKQDYTMTESACVRAQLDKNALIHLKPGESYVTDIDLSQPRWHIHHDNKRLEIGALDGWQQFRLVYRSPNL